MNHSLTLSLILLLIGVTGCRESRVDPAGQGNWGPLGRGTASDARGSHDHVVLHWQENRRILLLGIVQHEKDPIAPRYFVIGKLQPLKTGIGASSEVNFSQSSGTSGLEMRVSASEGPTITYHLAGDSNKERLAIGANTYGFANGRVFLVDQSTDPPSVQQINAGWETLFENKKLEFTRDEFTAALESLADKHEEVREFLAAFEKK